MTLPAMRLLKFGIPGLLTFAACATLLASRANHLFESEVIRPSPGASYFVEQRMANYDVVAWGQFVKVCDDVVGAEWFRSRDVTTSFRVEELFKGYQSTQELAVVVPADILAFPGETKTRYEVREGMLASLDAAIEDAQQRLEELERERSEMNPQAYLEARQRESTSLTALVDEQLARFPGQGVAVVHGKLMWEGGGVIRTGQKYLLTVNRNRGGEYRLSDVHEGLLWWGEEASQMLAYLRREHGAITVANVTNDE